MSSGSLIGTLGVTLLLIAFALNLAKKMPAESRAYLLLNFVGSLLAGISSYLIAFWPFVVLEGVWALASLYAFTKTFKKL